MKKNKKIVFLLLSLILLTGCTRQFKDADGKVVTSKETNQVLVENILCKPVELLDTYQEAINKKKEDLSKKLEAGDISKKDYDNKVSKILNIEKLPACKNISVSEGKYESFWTTVFVKPLAWLLVNIGKLLFNNYALSVIVVTIIIKLVLLPFSMKSLRQSENLKKAQPKLNKIEKKYANKTDQESMMQKSNEMIAVYKEYKINPISGCLLGIIQIPLFFAFYEALNRLPILFEGKFLWFHMGTTPLAAFKMGDWYYLILPVLVGVVTYFSFKMNNNTMPEDQAKQMKTMLNIMMIMILITSFSMSMAIILYWIINSLFTIVQNLIIKRSK